MGELTVDRKGMILVKQFIEILTKPKFSKASKPLVPATTLVSKWANANSENGLISIDVIFQFFNLYCATTTAHFKLDLKYL